MRPSTLFRYLWLSGTFSLACACGDDPRVLGERTPESKGRANPTGSADTSTQTSGAAGGTGGSDGQSSNTSGDVQTAGTQSNNTASSTAGGASGGSESSSGGTSATGGAGGSASGAGGATPCGNDVCSSDEWCCGPEACGTCYPLGTDPACPVTCDATTSGTGGSGNACDPGCEPVPNSATCGENERTWECRRPDYNQQLMEDNCLDIMTGLIRYCCPADFLADCSRPAGTTG